MTTITTTAPRRPNGVRPIGTPSRATTARAKAPASKVGPDPVDVQVGAEIRSRRHRLGFSQGELAHACGVTFQQIQKYERGANRVSASMIVRVADFLRCRPGDLFPASAEAASVSPLFADALKIAVVPHGEALIADLAKAHPDDIRVLAGALAAINEVRASLKRSH